MGDIADWMYDQAIDEMAEVYCSGDIPEYHYNEKKHWPAGFHYDKNEKTHVIKEMTDDHLLATIHYFKNKDTTPLEKEAKKRGLSFKKVLV